ncbi:hypothetical protein B0O99DRAFT_649019 [Bisporella sp. PMI_857]|nr:hypothetical protein B0O99DRAFT_649019 [Bisporella sp. PMI_857]
MPSDDYASAVGGGLKLKGVKDSGVKKKKKKKASKGDPSISGEQASALQKALAGEDEDAGKQQGGKEGEDPSEDELRTLDHRGNDGKTAAERAHEEMRRRRLQDRLQKEGVKTHKQRVEELNKYLSNLSEHHDMPRIGPG